MRRSTKILGALAATVAVVGTACGSSGGSTALKFSNDKPPFTTAYDAMSTAAKKQIGLSLKVNPYASTPAFETAIRSSGAAGEKPALFTWHTGQQLDQLVPAHEVANTSSIWKAAIANGTLPASLEKYYTVGGQQYCVPFSLDYWGMFYNKQVFAKYHLAIPTTWTQLLQVAATLKSHGQTPFYEADQTFSFVWFELLLGSSDPSAYNEVVSGKMPFTAAPVQHAMQLWASLIDKGYMSNPAVTTNAQNLLANGQVAMAPFGTWFNASMASINTPTSKYGFFLIPNVNASLTKKVTFLETGPVCASPGVSTTKDAMKMLSWWISTPAQKVWAKAEQDISPNPKVAAPTKVLTAVSDAAAKGQLEPLERYYEAVPATVLTESLNDFSVFEVKPTTYMTQLENIQKVNAKAYGKS
jgi:multiple sugar transport system substrate-binding protein